MHISKQTLESRRIYLRGLFAEPRDASIFDVIDIAVRAFSEGPADDEIEPTLDFPINHTLRAADPQRIAV